jgi:hypothetical protein
MEEQKYKFVRGDSVWSLSGWTTCGKPCVYTEDQIPETLDDGYYTLHKGETVEDSYYKARCPNGKDVRVVKV